MKGEGDLNMGRPRKNETETIKPTTGEATVEQEVASVIKEIRKDFGDDSILTFDSSTSLSLPKISSGILPLDMVLGGGYCLGRIIEIFGPESSGKTTIATKAIASFQSNGKICAFIDAEHAFDPQYAKALGVNLDVLLYSAPDNGEQALEMAETLVRTGKVGLIVIDSVAALVPKKEIDGDMGDSNVGLHARLMSQAMRKLTAITAKSNCVIIFINQIREKVGVIYGNPEVTTGGRALKFYSSVRLDVRKKETVKEGNESIANHVRVKTVKNKTFPPYKECEFDIIFGKGPDDEGSLVDLAIEAGIIEKAGSWFTLQNGSRFHGKDQIKQFFNTPEGEEPFNEVKEKLRNLFNENNALTTSEETPDEEQETLDKTELEIEENTENSAE